MPRRTIVLLIPALAVVLAVCGEDASGPDLEAPDIDSYVDELGNWEEFAPPLPDADEPSGPPDYVERVADATTYECTETPHSLTTTPRDIVMYEPNASTMWVGNLIQGRSYRDGVGSFQELSIRQRAPLKISIDLLTEDNSAIVENPSLTSVQAAIGQLIERAHERGHRSGSNIHYTTTRLHTMLQATYQAGMSARFVYKGLPLSVGASRELEARAELTGVMANFTQKMFTISIELPQNPSAMFSDELTDDLFQQQVDAGNIGRDNLPVYIAQITYGRALMYGMWAAETEAHLRQAVDASATGLGEADIEYGIDVTLEAANIELTTIGGEGQNVLNLIRTGELSEYFRQDDALTAARPLSYQLNFLGDNSIARVSETGEYTLRTCEEKVDNPGRFDLLTAQNGAAGMPTPYRTLTGDVDGDGYDDLILSHLGQEGNQFRVGHGQADGTFVFDETVAHPVATPLEAAWGSGYEAHIGDFDGDGRDDMAWNWRQDSRPNVVYVSLATEDGGWSFLEPQELGSSWATGWTTHVTDANGDGREDLVFSFLGNINRTFAALAQADAPGTFVRGSAHDISGTWHGYVAAVADVDNDGRGDILWNNVPGAANNVRTATSNGDATFTTRAGSSFLSGWQNYDPVQIGYIVGGGNPDLVWTNTNMNGGQYYVHRALGNDAGRFDFVEGVQYVARPEEFSTAKSTSRLGDFNGDGRTDVVFNDLTATSNRVKVGLGHEDATFRFTPQPQSHQAVEDWTQFRVVILDATGDGIDDIVWIQETTTPRVYVAAGRAPGG